MLRLASSYLTRQYVTGVRTVSQMLLREVTPEEFGPSGPVDPFLPSEAERRTIQGRHLLGVDGVQSLPEPVRDRMAAVASVMPFKVNGYVLDNLIDWDDPARDPIFQLTFPQPDMLTGQEQQVLLNAAAGDDRSSEDMLRLLSADPGGQMEHNVPTWEGKPLTGVQHKYPNTVLIFPSTGQTCHAYCAYCFRWPQFKPQLGIKHSIRDVGPAVAYVKAHPEVTDLLFTGGDVMIMTTDRLRTWIEPFLAECPDVRHIRIGTKSLSYWPYRFTDGDRGESVIDFLREIVDGGRSVNVMAHLSHPKEMSTAVFAEAVRRVRATGATIRSQAPLTRHINDDPQVWATMWQQQVDLGIVPYYMFVPRPTGNHAYYSVPLARCLEIYQEAIHGVSGLGRTVRGPVMSCDAGKVLVEGTIEIGGQRYFVMRFLQARDAGELGEIRLYKYDDQALWIDDLEPATL